MNVVVVGGGLSGLIAARELRTAGIAVTIIERGFPLGGRYRPIAVDAAGVGRVPCDPLPIQNIDPRAVTEFWPVFDTVHTSVLPALPSATAQVYGAGITVALSDRLAFGLNQGGYAQAVFSREEPGLFPDRRGVLRDRRQYSGLREGWLNFGGFGQYTVIEDVEDQFLLTAGLRWEAPSGASQLFQGRPPWRLAPYLTAGKEIGNFHVLATTGFDFAAGSSRGSNYFYANLHIDRQCFDWLYPLVEFNWTYHSTNVSLDLPTRYGFINADTFSNSGNVVALAAGANAVIVRNKLELGAVYSTLIASQHGFKADGLLVKGRFGTAVPRPTYLIALLTCGSVGRLTRLPPGRIGPRAPPSGLARKSQEPGAPAAEEPPGPAPASGLYLTRCGTPQSGAGSR